MNVTKIIIAGGRYESVDRQRIIWLRDIIDSYEEMGGVEIVSGAAPGIDTFAISYARVCKIPTAIFGADWNTHGKAAGPIRNKLMAEYADVCILFPGGRGTASMKSEATKAGLIIHEWKGNEDGK